MTDPRTTWRKRTAMLWIAAGPMLVASALAIVVRHDLPEVEAPELAVQEREKTEHDVDEPAAEPIDDAVFMVRLWNPPPRPADERPKHQEVVERIAPLNLTLIGIVSEGGLGAEFRKAALYDPVGDLLHMLGQGDSFQQHIVIDIGADHALFQSGSQTQRLQLIPHDGRSQAELRGRGDP